MLSMLSACILLVTSITMFSMTSAATIASSSGNANSCHEIASNLIKMNKDLIQAVFYAKFFKPTCQFFISTFILRLNKMQKP